jgi:diaminopimelate decarboxylase
MSFKFESDKEINEDSINTPYFIINENEIQKNILDMKKALKKYWRNYIIGYSFKTNSLPWLVNYYKKNDVFAEVVSYDEYELAILIGYDNKQIIYNGPIKSKETFIQAVNNNSIVNIDSQRELYWLEEMDSQAEKNYEIGIRINFDLEKYCPNESAVGINGGRFGFCYENGELKKAIEFIDKLKNVNITGIHLHCSTKTRSLNVYRTISKIACEIKSLYKLTLKYVDIGGGFFGGLKDKPQFNEYMEVISSELRKEFNIDETILIVEPGTAFISSPISFVTSVTDVKHTISNCFIQTDGSRLNIDPLMNKSKYFYHIEYVDKIPEEVLPSQVITGYTCMEHDRMFVLEDKPLLSVGDKIVYENVGAYTMSLSPMFIQYYPAVYLKENSNIYLVRERWSNVEYIKKSRF